MIVSVHACTSHGIRHRIHMVIITMITIHYTTIKIPSLILQMADPRTSRCSNDGDRQPQDHDLLPSKQEQIRHPKIVISGLKNRSLSQT